VNWSMTTNTQCVRIVADSRVTAAGKD
jgi:hypothetical protein